MRVRDAPVDRGRELERHERALGLRVREQERGVERRGPLGEHAERHGQSVGAQRLSSAPRRGVRIADRGDHARHPAAMSASVQGGVLPWWAHGSRFTTRVAPRARAPAAASAATSACGPPNSA